MELLFNIAPMWRCQCSLVLTAVNSRLMRANNLETGPVDTNASRKSIILVALFDVCVHCIFEILTSNFSIGFAHFVRLTKIETMVSKHSKNYAIVCPATQLRTADNKEPNFLTQAGLVWFETENYHKTMKT